MGIILTQITLPRSVWEQVLFECRNPSLHRYPGRVRDTWPAGGGRPLLSQGGRTLEYLHHVLCSFRPCPPQSAQVTADLPWVEDWWGTSQLCSTPSLTWLCVLPVPSHARVCVAQAGLTQPPSVSKSPGQMATITYTGNSNSVGNQGAAWL